MRHSLHLGVVAIEKGDFRSPSTTVANFTNFNNYLTYSWEDKGIRTFANGICPKVNVIARLEFERAYYDSVVQRFNHHTTRYELNPGLLDLWRTLDSFGQCMMVKVFANGPGDLGSIQGLFILKTQKMVLDASLLNTQHYKVRIKCKAEKSREKRSGLPYTPRCSSYRKGSFRVTLDLGRQLYFTFLYLLFTE